MNYPLLCSRPRPVKGPARIHRNQALLAVLLVGGLSVALPSRAVALAIASSNISISGFTVSPTAGTLTLLSDWTASGFSEAQNSLGQQDNPFGSIVGSAVVTAANVTWADASGAADAAGLTAAAGAHANLPGTPNANSSATGLGTLSTTFQIANAGSGNVDVEFSLSLLTSLSVFTSLDGRLAESEAILSLEVGGQTVLLHSDRLSIGPSDSDAISFDGPVLDKISLNFNTPYQLVVQLDSEARVVTVPESAGLPAGLVVPALAVVHKRRRRPVFDPGSQDKGGLL